LVENVVGDIDATSGGGNVVYRNVETPDRSYPADLVHIRNAGGALDVDEAPGGADVSTGGGDIWIGTAKKSVHARTGGGDIEIEAVDGWVKASTGAGDIDVAMVGDPTQGKRDVTLLTGYGDVTLIVPKGLSADVEVELAFTKKKEGRCGIESDLPLAEETTSEWDYDHGEPLKYIYGQSVKPGGEHKIKIRTTNGNVVIREGK
jgi:DUF4097 and DUF4098 domain-containing protein YvlB